MILRTILIFFCAGLCAPRSLTAQAAHDPLQWEPAIKEYETLDRESFPPVGAVLFIGSSSIRMWKTLTEDFAPLAVINRGFGGSWIRDSIMFADRIIIPYKPSKIVFYAGENDIAGGEPPAVVLADFERLEGLIHEKLPGIPVFFVSMKPSPVRWEIWDRVRRANELIRAFCERTDTVRFVDVASPMLRDDGSVRTDIFIEDNLHMNDAGYRIWTSIIKPLLSE